MIEVNSMSDAVKNKRIAEKGDTVLLFLHVQVLICLKTMKTEGISSRKRFKIYNIYKK
jgi:hypothetical protein